MNFAVPPDPDFRRKRSSFLWDCLLIGSALAALALMAGAVFAADHPWEWTADADHHEAICRVSGERSGRSIRGTGVLVWSDGDRGLVLTNQHVVAGVAKLLCDDKPATLLAYDQHADLAALVIRDPDAIPIPVSATSPAPGEDVEIVAYRPGRHYLATIAGYQADDTILLDTTVIYGDSGSPVLYGEPPVVVGLVRAGNESIETRIGTQLVTGKATSGDRIRRFLRRFAPHALDAPLQRNDERYFRFECPGGRCPLRQAPDRTNTPRAYEQRLEDLEGQLQVLGARVEAIPDFDQIAQEVQHRLPPLAIEVVSRDGKTITREERRLGETFRLYFAPVTP